MENTEKPIRTFFAFEIDAEARQAATDVIEYLRKQKHGDQVKWSKPEKLHVTLRFLGDVEVEKITEISRNVADEIKGIKPFTISLGKIMAFPPHHPHIIAIDMPLSAELAELVYFIERGVARSGFEPEDRPFFAHITLGRLRYPRDLAFDTVPTKLPAQLSVKEVIFFRSDSGEEGSVYTPLLRLALAE